MDATARFHKQRLMFWVSPSGKIILADKGDARSHADWLRDEFGIVDQQLRGYIDRTGIYFYSTHDCQALPGDVDKISLDLGHIILYLDLDADLPVYAGTIPGKPGKRWKGRDKIGVAKDFVS